MAAGADAHENTFSFGTFVGAGHIFVDAFSAFGTFFMLMTLLLMSNSAFGIFC